MNKIGTLQENSLHASLKDWYQQPQDQLESSVDGYIIDLVRGNLLVEIQTRNFYSIKQKLANLLERHPVRLVYPIPYEKWILQLTSDGNTLIRRRKSPKRGKIIDIYQELIRFPRIVRHQNFTMEALMVRVEVVWRDDGKGSWRRKGKSIIDQRLIEVVDSRIFSGLSDYQSTIPKDIPELFTVRDLATVTHQPRRAAGKMAYCLREMGVLEAVGKRDRSIEYRLVP